MQYQSSIIKNHKITNKNFFDGVPLKGYVCYNPFCTKNRFCNNLLQNGLGEHLLQNGL